MSTLMMIYIGISLVSVLLLLATLLLGIGHDFDHGAIGDSSDLSDGPSWLGTKVILGACAGFGLFGLAGFWFGLPAIATFAPAVFGLFLMAYIVRNWIIIPLMRQQSNSLLSRVDYIGKEATVWLSITPENSGQVRFHDSNDTLVIESAICEDETLALATGTPVRVVDVTSTDVVVSPIPSTEGI